MTSRRVSKITAPIVVAEWPRNRSGEIVRVVLDSYEGHDLISIRIWAPAEDGILRPSKKGVALTAANWPALFKAIAAAEVKAVELGLLDEAADR